MIEVAMLAFACFIAGAIAVPLTLHGRLVADDDWTGAINVRVVQKPIPHVCAQTRLDQIIPALERRSSGEIS